jgi:5-methylcytosine-specific restriction endonuclease McrA
VDWSDPVQKRARINELVARRRREDPEKRKASRKAQKLKSRATKIAALMESQKGKCAYCRVKLDRSTLNVDHIVPRALRGGNEIANLQLTCWGCNNAKRAQRPEDFARSLGRLI